MYEIGADKLVALLKLKKDNSTRIVERFYCWNSHFAWNVRGWHSEVETWVGFTYVYLVGKSNDVIACDVELH